MRSTLRHLRIRIRVAVAALSVGLIVASTVGGSAVAFNAGPGGLPAGCTWTIHELPMPPGWIDGFARRGDGSSFVGYGTDPGGAVRSLLWRQGAVTELASPGGAEAEALDVNRRGAVLAFTHFQRPRPFVWINGRVVPLAVPAGATSTIGYAINDAGIIVGSAVVAGATHGIVWSLRSPQRYRDLGVADGSLDLNDLTETGVIVGSSQTSDPFTGPIRALRGTVAEGLSSLPGVDPAQDSHAARAAGRYVIGIGQVPGAAADRSGVLWKGDVATALPPAMGALAVNSKGLVAGYISDGRSRVTTWAAGTTWTLPDLSDFAPLGNSAANDVMEDGTVIGGSTTADGRSVPVTWTCG
ncbi:MAG TPA: hypothetical protein VLL08_28035 [Kineosporiaceae bacterium]|nr:hypothetical protein [Kineosporiaceae bacterium]